MVKRKPRKKTVKKKWYAIMAPKQFRNQEIGETVATDPSKITGRIIETNIMQLTGEPRKQSIRIVLRITDVKENTAQTEIIAYKIAPSYLKRNIRKNVGKIEDSFITETKDKAKIRIKPFMTTRKRAVMEVKKQIRKQTQEYIKEYVKKKTFQELITSAIAGTLQKDIREKAKKLYPLSSCELRIVQKI